MDPFLLPKAMLTIVLFGLSLWKRVLGTKTVPVMAGLAALSTLAVLLIEGCDLA